MQVFDIRTQKAIANCTDHKGAVNSISFSENGEPVLLLAETVQTKI